MNKCNCVSISEERQTEILKEVIWNCSVKKVFLNNLQNSQENYCVGACNLIKRETPAKVFFKNIFFGEHLRTADSRYSKFGIGFTRLNNWKPE